MAKVFFNKCFETGDEISFDINEEQFIGSYLGMFHGCIIIENNYDKYIAIPMNKITMIYLNSNPLEKK